MLPAERRSRIVAALGERPALSVAELAQMLEASEMTIRRDLAALSADGQVRKVHGGALAAVQADRSAEVRSVTNVRAKAAIATLAAALVREHATLVLDSGTTIGALARALRGRHLTVVTTSLIVLRELGDAPTSAVHLVGGRFRPETQSVSGPQVAEAMGDFSADHAFVAASAIHDGSYYNYYPEDAAIQRRMVEIARESWLLADASKLSAVALGRVGALRDLAGVITDDSASPAQLDELRASCRRVVVAGPESAPPEP
jgi:DeoR/GlpR family transcriptional regulator of sugar metabolism